MHKTNRQDVTKITHANECACKECREWKGEAFRFIVEPEPEFNPLDKPWYLESVTQQYKEYRLNWRYIDANAIEYRYEFFKKGKL